MDMLDFDPAFADAVGSGSADAAPVTSSEQQDWELWLAQVAQEHGLSPNMEPVRIERAAVLVGMTPRILRYMENEGVIAPRRTPAGYRLYDYGDLLALALLAVLSGRFGVTTAELRFLRRLSEDRALEAAVRTLGRLTRHALYVAPRGPEEGTMRADLAAGALKADSRPDGGKGYEETRE